MSYKKCYAYYIGDDFIDLGSSDYLCNKYNWTLGSFFTYVSKAGKSSFKGKVYIFDIDKVVGE